MSFQFAKHLNENNFPNQDFINFLFENYTIKNKSNNKSITKNDLLNYNEVIQSYENIIYPRKKDLKKLNQKLLIDYLKNITN